MRQTLNNSEIKMHFLTTLGSDNLNGQAAYAQGFHSMT